MKNFKRIFLIALSALVLGCQTLRIQYESTIETEAGEKQKFTYVDSYEVGGAHSTLCAITGIFWGGYCWFYLVMPTNIQKQGIEEDAQNYLDKTFKGKKYDESHVRISRVNFSEGEKQVTLVPWADRKH